MSITPPNDKQISIQGVSIEHYSLLPSASELQGYNEVYPQAAKIILTSFQKQTEHRMEQERKDLEQDIESRKIDDALRQRKLEMLGKESLLAMLIGSGILLTLVVVGVIALFTGHEVAGSILLSVTALKYILEFIASFKMPR